MLSLPIRGIISILAGIGAGTVGFVAMWFGIAKLLHVDPGLNHDVWLLAAIFAPGIATAILSFFAISPKGETQPA